LSEPNHHDHLLVVVVGVGVGVGVGVVVVRSISQRFSFRHDEI